MNEGGDALLWSFCLGVTVSGLGRFLVDRLSVYDSNKRLFIRVCWFLVVVVVVVGRLFCDLNRGEKKKVCVGVWRRSRSSLFSVEERGKRDEFTG